MFFIFSTNVKSKEHFYCSQKNGPYYKSYIGCYGSDTKITKKQYLDNNKIKSFSKNNIYSKNNSYYSSAKIQNKIKKCDERPNDKSKLKCLKGIDNYINALINQGMQNDQGSETARAKQYEQNMQNNKNYINTWIDTRSGYEKYIDKWGKRTPGHTYWINRARNNYLSGAPMSGYESHVLGGTNTFKIIRNNR